jgi:hypothetical protein
MLVESNQKAKIASLDSLMQAQMEMQRSSFATLGVELNPFSIQPPARHCFSLQAHYVSVGPSLTVILRGLQILQLFTRRDAAAHNQILIL